jgi:hypothetical protein
VTTREKAFVNVFGGVFPFKRQEKLKNDEKRFAIEC